MHANEHFCDVRVRNDNSIFPGSEVIFFIVKATFDEERLSRLGRKNQVEITNFLSILTSQDTSKSKLYETK